MPFYCMTTMKNIYDKSLLSILESDKCKFPSNNGYKGCFRNAEVILKFIVLACSKSKWFRSSILCQHCYALLFSIFLDALSYLCCTRCGIIDVAEISL